MQPPQTARAAVASARRTNYEHVVFGVVRVFFLRGLARIGIH